MRCFHPQFILLQDMKRTTSRAAVEMPPAFPRKRKESDIDCASNKKWQCLCQIDGRINPAALGLEQGGLLTLGGAGEDGAAAGGAAVAWKAVWMALMVCCAVRQLLSCIQVREEREEGGVICEWVSCWMDGRRWPRATIVSPLDKGSVPFHAFLMLGQDLSEPR